jgi:hypothetical protein
MTDSQPSSIFSTPHLISLPISPSPSLHLSIFSITSLIYLSIPFTLLTFLANTIPVEVIPPPHLVTPPPTPVAQPPEPLRPPQEEVAQTPTQDDAQDPPAQDPPAQDPPAQAPPAQPEPKVPPPVPSRRANDISELDSLLMAVEAGMLSFFFNNEKSFLTVQNKI